MSLLRIKELEAELTRRDARIAELEGVRPQADNALRQVDMGFGKFAVGGCKHFETGVPGIIYLHLPEPREFGADTSDVYPENSQPNAEDIASNIFFHTPGAMQQTIDVLLELQREHFPLAASVEAASVAKTEQTNLSPFKNGMIFKLDAWHGADEWISRAGSDERNLNNAFAAGAKWQSERGLDAAQPAPASSVPSVMEVPDDSMAVERGYVAGWNDCRKAMLAAAQKGGAT